VLLGIIFLLGIIILVVSINCSNERKKLHKERVILYEEIKYAQKNYEELEELKWFNKKLVDALTDTMYKNSPMIRLEMAEAVLDGSYKVKDFYPDN